MLVILLTDLALSGYAQYVVAGGPRATAALRSDASDLLAFVAARALVMPLIAFAADRAWRRAGRGAARIDGYAALAEDGDGLARRQGRADFQRDAWLALLFVLASVCQGYVGVKLCVFDLDGFPKRDRAQIAVAMGCTTLCINAEAWLLSSVVQLRTKLLAASTVHKHPLAYVRRADTCGRVAAAHAAAMWTSRGDGVGRGRDADSPWRRRHRGRDADSPRRRVAAAPRPRRR